MAENEVVMMEADNDKDKQQRQLAPAKTPDHQSKRQSTIAAKEVAGKEELEKKRIKVKEVLQTFKGE